MYSGNAHHLRTKRPVVGRTSAERVQLVNLSESSALRSCAEEIHNFGGKQMICPNCNNEMIKGKLLGSQIKLKWIPDGQKVTHFGFTQYENEIILKNSGGGGRPQTESFVCKECNKLIVDL